jgi:hypothetical protein
MKDELKVKQLKLLTVVITYAPADSGSADKLLTWTENLYNVQTHA